MKREEPPTDIDRVLVSLSRLNDIRETRESHRRIVVEHMLLGLESHRSLSRFTKIEYSHITRIFSQLIKRMIQTRNSYVLASDLIIIKRISRFE